MQMVIIYSQALLVTTTKNPLVSKLDLNYCIL